jgi:secreted protein with Ig-like and vWFA domain
MLTFLSDALRGGDYKNTLRVSALTFSKRSVVEFHFNTHANKPNPEQEILNNIAEMVYTKGVTNTSGALRVAREQLFQEENGDRDEVQNLAVIITDGNSNVDRDPVQDADKLKDDGVYIFGIAVGTNKSINWGEIEAIVSDPNELVRLKTYDDLIPLRETIIQKMCKRGYQIYFTSKQYLHLN